MATLRLSCCVGLLWIIATLTEISVTTTAEDLYPGHSYADCILLDDMKKLALRSENCPEEVNECIGMVIRWDRQIH